VNVPVDVDVDVDFDVCSDVDVGAVVAMLRAVLARACSE
jgi:hypothetical protein